MILVGSRKFTQLSLVLALLGCFATAPALAQTGTVAGIVREAASGQRLPGANVILERTRHGVASDKDGRFVLTAIPAGSYSLAVSYLGYNVERQAVTLAAGQVLDLVIDMTPSALEGEGVVVLGARAQGQAKALTQQQYAPNIANIVASDQIGRFPDASAPDALQRLPGIGVQRDQGEGRFIQIRGGAPQFTTVTFNGERIPSPEGDVRQIALDAVPTEILDAIEVSKAITPDMDADAIGGSVNLVTRRAPGSQVAALDFAGGYGPIREQGSFKGAATIGDRFSDGKLGVLLNASLNRRNFGSDNVETEFDFGDDDVPLGGDDELETLEVRYYDLTRQRLGLNGMLDYQFSPQSSVFLRGVFVQLQDTEQRHILENAVADDELLYLHKNRTEYLRSMSLSAGGKHVLTGGGLELDYRVGYIRSEEDTPEDTEIEWVQEDVTYAPSIDDPDDIRANPEDGALSDASAFLFGAVEPSISVTSNVDYVAAGNLKMPFSLGDGTGRLQLGGKFRLKEKKQDITEGAFELADGADDIALGDGNGVAFGDYYDADKFEAGFFPLPPVITPNKEVLDFATIFSSVLELDDGAELEGNLEDFEATEQTVAGYVMAELNLTPSLMLLPGVRYEHTSLEATGYESVFEEELDEGDVETDLVDIMEVDAENSYGFLFPMLHARYSVDDQTNIRAAFTTAMARPNFFDLAPYQIRDDDELVLGNPELDPSRSMNLDLLVERYSRAIGVISGGAFYKQIQDPIITVVEEIERTVDGETVEINQFQSQNGESGYIWGVELAAQQQLRFLPGALGGLGVYLNYTYTQSEAVLADGSTNVYPGQADHIFNAALSYERSGFSGQISLNYSGEFLDEFAGDGASADRANDIFVAERWGLDLSASYRVLNGPTVYVELVNLLNEPLRLYQGDERRPIQREYYRSWGWIGAKYQF